MSAASPAEVSVTEHGNEAGRKFKLAVRFGDGSGGCEAIAWASYGTKRAKFIAEHPELYEGQAGVVVPTFEEELAGRRILGEWCLGAQQSKQPTSAYFSDLLRVYQAGFMAEYVWLFLSVPTWREEDRPKRMPAFMAWAKIQLAKHVVETYGGVRIELDGVNSTNAAAQAPCDVRNGGGAEFLQATREAQALFQQGDRADAVRKLDEVIQATRGLQSEPGAAYLCFRNQREIIFFVLGHPGIREVRAVNWCVAEALFLKGFILSQEQRFKEALSCLEELHRLAPLMAQATGERGYVLNKLGRPREALTAYSNAWDLVTRLPANLGHAGPVLRGMAFALVELGDLDGAEKLLLESLVIEPESDRAKRELAYIAKVRHDGKPT